MAKRRHKRKPAPRRPPAEAPAEQGPWGLPLAGVLLTAFVALSASLWNGFLWDDEVLIQANPLIRSLSHFPTILTSGFWAGASNYYRPLPILTFLADHVVWGTDTAFGFHLSNILMHLAVCAALFALLRRRFSPRAAFWACALYAVHPVHAASIVPAYARDNVLVGLTVVSLLALDGAPARRRDGFLCAAFFALALLAKESALVFPVVAAAYGYCHFDKEQRSRVLWVYALLFGLAAAYVLIRLKWMPFVQTAPLSLIAQQPLPVRAWTFLRSLVVYAGLLVFPWRLHTERHFAAGPLDPLAWLGLALGAAAAIYAWRRGKDRPHLLFGFVWFLIPLGPVSNLVPLAMTMAEQWLYVPAMGACWILAGSLDRLPRKSAAAAGWAVPALAAALILFMARTHARARDWRDGMTLYTRDLRYARHSFLLHNNLGVELFRTGRLPEAEVQFRAAYAINPRYGTTLNNLGVIDQRKGNLAAAEKAYREAVLHSDYDLAYVNLAKLLAGTGRAGEAVGFLRRGRAVYPHNTEIAALLLQLEAALRASKNAP